MQKAAGSGIIEEKSKPPATEPTAEPEISTKAGGDVNYICRLDRSIYSCVSEDITTDEVVITQKQINHILEGHTEKEHARVLERLAESVQVPDFILRDHDPQTAIIFKAFEGDNEERYRVILKLATNDPQHPQNSIITAFYISEKKWNKYLRNKKILYRRE